MGDLALYLTMAVIGYFTGSRMRQQKRLIQWTGRLQTCAIILLIFTMGMRMGANREIIENLNAIGLYALVMTVFIIFFSVAAMTLCRIIMGIDKQCNRRAGGSRKHEEGAVSQESAAASGGVNTMTIIILLCVIGGLSFGHLAVPHFFDDMEKFGELAGSLISVGLCVLLFFVGFDMGTDGTVLLHFRQVGLRVLAFPFFIMAGTLFGAGICSVFLPGLSLREALAIGGGFGWYSFAPGIIMEAGLVTTSAISFMHNVMREMVSVLIIPFVARKAGYLEAVAVPACSSMDVCLPIIERATRSDIAMYAFICGVIESAAVPVIVPLILG